MGIESMEGEDKGMSRSNPPKILRHAEITDSLLMRFLCSRTRPMVRHSTNDGVGGCFSSGESPSSPAGTTKKVPTPSVNMEVSVLMRLLCYRTKPMIQQSTDDGVGGSSSGEPPSSQAETLKAEPTPSVNREGSLLMRFLRSRTKPMIQQSTNDAVGGSSSRKSPSSPEEILKTERTPPVNIEEDVLQNDGITVDDLMTADFSDFDGFSELERQFSQENLQLLPTHFPTKDRTKGRNMCREFLRTGRCTMGTMCTFSHQPPLLHEPEPAAAQIEVVRPRLFVPSPPLRPLQRQPMPLRQFLQLQTGGPPDSPTKEATSGSGAASTADIKADSSPTGDGTGIPPISTQSAALPQRPSAQTPKSSNEEAGDGSGTSSACASSSTATTADWSPMDDGIPVTLPGSSSGAPPSRDDVNRYIEWVLYGDGPNRSRRRRLPVFQDICPDTDAENE